MQKRKEKKCCKPSNGVILCLVFIFVSNESYRYSCHQLAYLIDGNVDEKYNKHGHCNCWPWHWNPLQYHKWTKKKQQSIEMANPNMKTNKMCTKQISQMFRMWTNQKKLTLSYTGRKHFTFDNLLQPQWFVLSRVHCILFIRLLKLIFST